MPMRKQSTIKIKQFENFSLAPFEQKLCKKMLAFYVILCNHKIKIHEESEREREKRQVVCDSVYGKIELVSCDNCIWC